MIAGYGTVQGDRQTATIDGANVTVDLKSVTNAQVIEVQIVGQTADGTTFEVEVPMRVLLGDTTGSGTVNASDVTLTKSRVGQIVNETNCRADVTASGAINASDVSQVKTRSGTFVP